mmetsp:Transcript_47271/g.119752  ORF Transcript_47271/g.119752 Transcript_47271/m.119752 type:complete len:250 (+) Transcript_47271:196-945(+)
MPINCRRGLTARTCVVSVAQITHEADDHRFKTIHHLHKSWSLRPVVVDVRVRVCHLLLLLLAPHFLQLTDLQRKLQAQKLQIAHHLRVLVLVPPSCLICFQQLLRILGRLRLELPQLLEELRILHVQVIAGLPQLLVLLLELLLRLPQLCVLAVHAHDEFLDPPLPGHRGLQPPRGLARVVVCRRRGSVVIQGPGACHVLRGLPLVIRRIIATGGRRRRRRKRRVRHLLGIIGAIDRVPTRAVMFGVLG